MTTAAAQARPVAEDETLALLPSLPAAQASPEGQPWRKERGGVWLDTGRVVRGELSPHERAALISFLEELLMRTRRAMTRPGRDGSPRG